MEKVLHGGKGIRENRPGLTFLSSAKYECICNKLELIPGYRTDHSAITLEVCFRQSERWKGY